MRPQAGGHAPAGSSRFYFFVLVTLVRACPTAPGAVSLLLGAGFSFALWINKVRVLGAGGHAPAGSSRFYFFVRRGF